MRKVLPLLLCVCISGCAVPWKRTTTPYEPWPILPEPEKKVVVIPAELDLEHRQVKSLVDALYDTIMTIEKLQLIVEMYNKNAKEHNRKAREALGIRSEVR